MLQVTWHNLIQLNLLQFVVTAIYTGLAVIEYQSGRNNRLKTERKNVGQ